MKFLVGGPPATSSVDFQSLLSSDDPSRGWLLNMPSTTVVSTVSLDQHLTQSSLLRAPSRPQQSSRVNNSMNTGNMSRQVVFSRKMFNERRYHRLSVSSESSDPGFVDDFFGCSDSDTSLEDESRYHVSADELWDSFWTSPKDYSSETMCNLQDDKQPAILHHAASYGPEGPLRQHHNNPPSINLPIMPKQSSISRSDATRSLNSARPGYQHRLSVHPETVYGPFPKPAPSQIRATSAAAASHHASSKSMPVNMDHSRPMARPTYRSRANTTPINTQHHASMIGPSNLRISSTSNLPPTPPNSSASSASRIWMQTPPLTPTYTTPLPLMELMEKSAFDDYDDDDDDLAEKSGLIALASKLNIRHGSASSEREKERGRDRPNTKSKKRFGRGTSDVIKGVLGIKKARLDCHNPNTMAPALGRYTSTS